MYLHLYTYHLYQSFAAMIWNLWIHLSRKRNLGEEWNRRFHIYQYQTLVHRQVPSFVMATMVWFHRKEVKYLWVKADNDHSPFLRRSMNQNWFGIYSYQQLFFELMYRILLTKQMHKSGQWVHICWAILMCFNIYPKKCISCWTFPRTSSHRTIDFPFCRNIEN